MKSFEELFRNAKKGDQFWVEKASLDFTIQLARLMENKGVSKAELARKIGKSPAYVTKLLNGYNNYTIGTMVKIARSIGGSVHIRVTPKEARIPNWLSVIDGKKTSKAKSKDDWANNAEVEVQEHDYLDESNG